MYKARIEEYNQKDRQAVIRAREERDKWLQIKNEAKDKKVPIHSCEFHSLIILSPPWVV